MLGFGGKQPNQDDSEKEDLDRELAELEEEEKQYKRERIDALKAARNARKRQRDPGPEESELGGL